MKKLIIVISALFALSAVALAQPRAIGIRVGHGGGFNLTGIYDFTCVENCFGVTELDFYAGPGTAFHAASFALGVRYRF